MMKNIDRNTLQEIDRELLKSSVSSIFFSAIAEKKRRSGFSFQALAERMGIHKSAVSRWFSSPPNWELNTVADIASALNLEIIVEARDRETGMVHTASGSPDHARITTLAATKISSAGADSTQHLTNKVLTKSVKFAQVAVG